MEGNQDKLLEELTIQKSINECVDQNESFCFNAGAGSGKTYALISSLQYALLSKNILNNSNKNVLCITYTNSAKDEIYDRLGINKQVYAATIHEFIWSIMKYQQPVLLKCHLRKIESEIVRIEAFLGESFYNNFSSDNKKIFTEIINQEEFIEQYREGYSMNASQFREKVQPFLLDEIGQSDLLRNVSKFKKVVDRLRKKERLEVTKNKIIIEEKGYVKVSYNSTNNRDHLENMEFSHDTLLEYGRRIIEEYDSYDIFKKIIIDRYPLVFIDEYQDTNEQVVKIFKTLSLFAKEKKYIFTVGYFGDIIQSIYDTGIGERIDEIHPDLKKIYKRFNRRSKDEIVKVINNIRRDDIVQESIYDQNSGGSVEIIKMSSENGDTERLTQIEVLVNSFYEEYRNKDNSYGKNKQFACLVLKHNTLAKIIGFENLYSIIQQMPRFKGTNYNQLNTEVLNNDSRNLGSFMRALKNMLELKMLLKKSKTPVNYVLKYAKIGTKNLNLKFMELQQLIEFLRDGSSVTIKDWLEQLIALLDRKDNVGKYIKILLTNQFTLDIEDLEFNSIQNVAARYFKCKKDEDFSNLVEFFDVNITEFEKWYSYISSSQDHQVNYMTYHSAKGLEFDNLMIVYDPQFARDRNFFKRFMQDLECTDVTEEDKPKWKSARNLFYVACSRAKINLRLVILDSDYKDVESGLSNLGFN